MGKKKKDKKKKEIQTEQVINVCSIYAKAEKEAVKVGSFKYEFPIPESDILGLLEVKAFRTSSEQLRTTWMLNGSQCPKMGVKSILDNIGRMLGETPLTRKMPYTKAARAFEERHGSIIKGKLIDGTSTSLNESDQDTENTSKKDKKKDKKTPLFSSENLSTMLKKKAVKHALSNHFDKKEVKEILLVSFGEEKKSSLSDIIIQIDKISELANSELQEIFSDLL